MRALYLLQGSFSPQVPHVGFSKGLPTRSLCRMNVTMALNAVRYTVQTTFTKSHKTYQCRRSRPLRNRRNTPNPSHNPLFKRRRLCRPRHSLHMTSYRLIKRHRVNSERNRSMIQTLPMSTLTKKDPFGLCSQGWKSNTLSTVQTRTSKT